MKSTGAFLIGLVIVIVGLQILKASKYTEYAWLYVLVLLLGMLIYNRSDLTTFSNELNAKMKERG